MDYILIYLLGMDIYLISKECNILGCNTTMQNLNCIELIRNLRKFLIK